jgi:hypothetical protein
MAIFTRSIVIALSLVACTFVAVWSSPSGTVVTGLLILVSGLTTLAIRLVSPGVAHAPVANRLPVIARKPAGPPVWPNSGFRNIGRGTKGG